MYDLIIIGAGPAGLSAAMNAGRRNLKTLVLSESIGGQIAEASLVENYPGIKSISGMELTNRFKEHAEKFGAEIKYREVKEIKKLETYFEVETTLDSHKGISIIITTGSKHRKLGIPGEEEFKGKGVSYCATCDGPLFKNKKVAVIGGSHGAVTSANYLSDLAEKVYIIYRGDKIRGEGVMVDRIEKKDNIEKILKSRPKEIKGYEVVSSIIIETEEGEKSLDVDGVFVEIGSLPAVDLAKHLNLELKGIMIEVDGKQRTSMDGVFAAGDITTGSGKLKQIVTAASEGAIAAVSAYRYIKKISQ